MVHIIETAPYISENVTNVTMFLLCDFFRNNADLLNLIHWINVELHPTLILFQYFIMWATYKPTWSLKDHRASTVENILSSWDSWAWQLGRPQEFFGVNWIKPFYSSINYSYTIQNFQTPKVFFFCCCCFVCFLFKFEKLQTLPCPTSRMSLTEG